MADNFSYRNIVENNQSPSIGEMIYDCHEVFGLEKKQKKKSKKSSRKISAKIEPNSSQINRTQFNMITENMDALKNLTNTISEKAEKSQKIIESLEKKRIKAVDPW